ncbi:hypothetical protein ACLOJK_018016 [Asimina triloba]
MEPLPPTPLLAIPSLQARPIRKWGRKNEGGCEEVVVLKEKGIFEGLRARVQLQNLLPLLVGASTLLVPSVTGESSLLVPSVAGALASGSALGEAPNKSLWLGSE